LSLSFLYIFPSIIFYPHRFLPLIFPAHFSLLHLYIFPSILHFLFPLFLLPTLLRPLLLLATDYRPLWSFISRDLQPSNNILIAITPFIACSVSKTVSELLFPPCDLNLTLALTLFFFLRRKIMGLRDHRTALASDLHQHLTI
jgi:hypothetical protein